MILIITLLSVHCAGWVEAKPFLTCDPQDGITEYKIAIPLQSGVVTHWETTVPAETDGSLKWDLKNWPLGKGTFTGQLSAGGEWQITDSETSVVSTVFEFSTPSIFIIKVPSYKVQNISGR